MKTMKPQSLQLDKRQQRSWRSNLRHRIRVSRYLKTLWMNVATFAASKHWRSNRKESHKLKKMPIDFAGHNYQVYQLDPVAQKFARASNLYPAEEFIFAEYETAIATARVLDIGVGGGRTTNYLLSRCQSYRAIDYSPAMIDACRRRFPECTPDVFAIGDARDLSAEPTEGYDFVLFSYNGLDYIDHEDRLQVLVEVRRVLSPGGLFFFSTHSLHAFPFSDPEVQERNEHVNLNLMRRQGWYYLIDGTASVVTHYIYPELQKQQLELAGLETVEVLDMDAQAFNFSSPSSDWMVHFLCRRVETLRA
jgi:SAM-dependent methyltransferase